MNREIKFRAWDLREERMRSVAFIEFDAAGEISNISLRGEGRNTKNSYQDTFEDRRDGEDLVLIQFTGLHDKNGKEIYEGDIVKHQMAGVREVEWLNVGWTPFMSYHAGELYEVIGNIYENPELLK